VKLLRIPRFHFGRFRKNRLFNDISVGIQISYIFNGGKIVPHTDSISKLLSILYYFPDNTVSNEEDFGTVFYNTEKKNFNNEHLDNERDELEFKKVVKLFTKQSLMTKILYMVLLKMIEAGMLLIRFLQKKIIVENLLI